MQTSRKKGNFQTYYKNNIMDIKSFATEQYTLALEDANNNGTSIEVELARNILDSNE